jgi:hypothetical protein
MPPGFALHQVAASHAIGPWRDELDVEYVRVYEVIR